MHVCIYKYRSLGIYYRYGVQIIGLILPVDICAFTNRYCNILRVYQHVTCFGHQD